MECTLEISSLYCFTTFMTLSPHYLVTFIILSLFINEETLLLPGYHRYGLWLGLFSFCSRHCGSFAGYAYLVRVVFIWFQSVCLLWLTVALILVFTRMPVSGLPTAWRLPGAKTRRAWWWMKWSACGLPCWRRPPGHVWYALGAFVLFRLFDIFKPLGIRRMESLPGGIGVMMDDIIGRSLRIYSFDCGKMDDLVEIKWQRCVVAPCCLDLLSRPSFLRNVASCCRFSGDYSSGETIWLFFILYATFTGSVVGGIVNCVINYGWVFHAEDCKKTHVAVKYLFVWGGSIILNTWGTFALTEWLTGMTWVNGLLGYYIDDVFILSKIIVASAGSFFLELPSATGFRLS